MSVVKPYEQLSIHVTSHNFLDDWDGHPATTRALLEAAPEDLRPAAVHLASDPSLRLGLNITHRTSIGLFGKCWVCSMCSEHIMSLNMLEQHLNGFITIGHLGPPKKNTYNYHPNKKRILDLLEMVMFHSYGTVYQRVATIN